MEKTVSVIVPAYNTEKYIERCLDSAREQSYPDLQIIVVDDGSCDKTFDIAQRLAAVDDRIEVYHRDNGGVSSARNMAIDLAKGSYIYFLDADDCLEPDAIEILVNAMEISDYDFVSCQYSRWDESGNRLEDFDFTVGEFFFDDDNDRMSFLIGTLLSYKAGFEVWDKLFKADIIKRSGIRFSEECRIGEDLGFNIKYLMNCKRLNCISQRPIRYTIRSSSAMGSLDGLPRMLSENALLASDIFSYVNDNNMEFFVRYFACIFVRIFDNSYIGHTPAEITGVLKTLGDISFIIERYRELDTCKEKILSMYPVELSKIKYKYHLSVRCALEDKYTTDKLLLFIYGIYRKVRGRSPIEDWRMPY